jgi:hypothetical protein
MIYLIVIFYVIKKMEQFPPKKKTKIDDINLADDPKKPAIPPRAVSPIKYCYG